MKVEIKNSNFTPSKIKPLFEYLSLKKEGSYWEYSGLIVELDLTIDFRENDALIRWFDPKEGFNEKIMVNSLEEFKLNFREVNA